MKKLLVVSLGIALCAGLIVSPSDATATCARATLVSQTGIASNGTEVASATPGSATSQEWKAPSGAISYEITPPDGFNAAQASDETLKAFAIPARPTDPGELQAWNQAYGDKPLHTVVTDVGPCTGSPYTHLSGPVSANWAGHEALSSPFTTVYGEVVTPTYATSPGCPGHNSDAVWVGIGGPGGTGLIQTGVDASDQINLNSLQNFYEQFRLGQSPPDEEWNPPYPHSDVNNLMYLRVDYNMPHSGWATYTINDISKSDSRSYQTPDASYYYSGIDAEFINERDLNQGSYDENRQQSNNTSWSMKYVNGQPAGAWRSAYVHMTQTGDNSGGLMETSTFVDNTDSYDGWVAC